MTIWDRLKHKMQSPATTTDYLVGAVFIVVWFTALNAWSPL
ncbi:MAG: hypothetical protein JWQ74_3545 [Marmoricola sp.]|nr:hypothetical protein [Marmoricola sp.]